MATYTSCDLRAKDLEAGIDAAQRYAPAGLKTVMKWDAMAHHTFHADVEDGQDGVSTNDFYDFTDVQRDRLLAHARQDAAQAVFGVHDAYQEARAARILSWLSLLLNIIMLGILVYVLFLRNS